MGTKPWWARIVPGVVIGFMSLWLVGYVHGQNPRYFVMALTTSVTVNIILFMLTVSVIKYEEQEEFAEVRNSLLGSFFTPVLFKVVSVVTGVKLGILVATPIIIGLAIIALIIVMIIGAIVFLVLSLFTSGEPELVGVLYIFKK